VILLLGIKKEGVLITKIVNYEILFMTLLWQLKMLQWRQLYKW